MKALSQTPGLIRGSALMLAAYAAAALLYVNTASGQSCPNNISPGETFTFTQASSGAATQATFSNGGAAAFAFSDGSDNPQGQTVAAAAVTVGAFGASADGYGQINYIFCIPGRINDQVTATVSGQISWYGILLEASLGSNVPSVTGSLNLIDMGTDGSGTNQVAGATPLNGNLKTLQISPIFLNVNISGGIVNDSVSVSFQTNVSVGHIYALEYNLDCQAPGGLALSVSFCDFTPTLPTAAIPFTNLPPGDYHSEVHKLTVSLGQDQYAVLLGIKAEVDTLSAKVSANDQDIAAAKLALEQENAQLLGLLNEIKSLLSALQSDPPTTSTPTKAKTSNPRPPIRPGRPRTMDPL